MALPAPDSMWPPLAHKPAYDAYRTWSAWYSGDPDELRRVYGATSENSYTPRVRTGQYAGGWYGRISRWFWGSPVSDMHRDGRLHVPLAGDIASAAADLLFSEPPALNADQAKGEPERKAAMARYEQLIEDGLHPLLLEGAEVQSALGGVYLRAVIDEDVVQGKAFSTVVHADGALPTFRYGRLMGVTFWRQLSADGDVYLRLLEDHTLGPADAAGNRGNSRIDFALYEGRRDNIGKAVPLTTHPLAAELAPHLDEFSGHDTGIKRLTVSHIPAMRPNRQWRGRPGLEDLGRSDYAGAESILDGLDETLSSLMRDIRLAKGRLSVPEQFLRSAGPGQGAYFDPEREVYSALNMMVRAGDSAGQQITVSQFEIRTEQHLQTCDKLTYLALRHAGFAEQTFGETGDAAATATEVVARERRSFTSRDRKIMYWRPGAADHIETLMELEAAHFGGPDPVRPGLDFGDSVSEDPKALADTAYVLYQAKAASTDTLVRLVHPDWDDDQVAAEVQKILDDQAAMVTVTDPNTFDPGPDPNAAGDGQDSGGPPDGGNPPTNGGTDQ
jgi:hypothetical protein